MPWLGGGRIGIGKVVLKSSWIFWVGVRIDGETVFFLGKIIYREEIEK
jgi:hypothetical protein